MLEDLTIAVLAIISAICYRLRGSDFAADWPPRRIGPISIRGDRVVKLAIGAAPVAVACALAGVGWWSLLVWPCVAAADALGHGEGMGINTGTDTSDELWAKGKQLGVQGLAAALMPGLAISAAYRDPILGLIVLGLGLLEVPSYIAGNILPWPSFTLPVASLRRGSEWGEALTGLCRVLFLIFII